MSPARQRERIFHGLPVSPGIGFGPYGDDYVRFSLIENEHRCRQATRGIKRALAGGPPGALKKAVE